MIRQLLLLALAANTVSAAVRIVSVEPTTLFPRATPLRQIAIVTLLNDGTEAVAGKLTAQFGTGNMGPALDVKLAPGATKHRLLVPDIAAAAEVEVVLAGASRLAEWKGAWQPQRKWKIYVVKSSHEDLGYENYIFKKQHDIAEFIDLAREQGKSNENVSELERRSDAKFHYTMESLLFQRNYIEERGEKAWREVVEKDIKTGNIHLMGAPSGVHSHWMDYEELARMTYPGRREAKDRFGLDLKTFMIVDNPSLSWSGMQAVAEAGFKYVARWGQGWRTGGNNDYKHTKLPALFWWQAPDRVHKVLFGWRTHYGLSFWYGQTGGGYQNLVDLAADNMSTQLKQIEDGGVLGPYPYDALVNPEYIDHDIPRFDTRVLPAWKEKYAYPEVHIASPEHFFEYIEKTYGSQLPLLSGDLNNFSADYATIDPDLHGMKRQAARLLPAAEGIGALATALNPSYFLSPSFVDRIYTRMFDFDEHSWPTLPRPSDVQLFNAAWVKKAEARRALDGAETAFANASQEFAKQFRTGASESIAVFNSLAQTRTELVRTKGNFPSLTDITTGVKIPVQKTKEGEVVFLAQDVPAFGFKIYKVEKDEAPATTFFEVGKDSLANEFYAVKFDATTGAVRSIVDKASGKELVDAKAPYLANQMIYQHKNERESKDGFQHSPARAKKMEGSKGPVQAEFSVWIDDDKTQAAIKQTVILYANLKRIDFVNELQHARVLFSKNYEDRYKENIFYAFPFDVTDGQPRVEYPGGVVRPYADQLRWGSHDYLYANRWVDVSNKEHGVTLVPWNAGTFEFGELRYNEFSIDYKPKTPWLFSHAWSNRMAELLTLNGDDCNATLGYSLLSHVGDWDSGEATRFAWSTSSPMLVIPLTPNSRGSLNGSARSFLSATAPNVQLTVLKNSEQPGRGWVARFVETQGSATEFVVNANTLQIDSAQETDLVENDVKALPVENGRIKVKVLPFGHVTIRMQRGAAPGAVAGFAAKGSSDSAVTLNWSASNGAAAYNIFRSEDPNAPPSAFTLVARSNGKTYIDRGLHIKKPYFYRIAAVNAANLQGEVSARVEATPDGPNTTPPAHVEELGVVRRAKDTLIVYWRTNPEPDVARYRLYRGESADFKTEGASPIAVIEPEKYFLQMYVDRGLSAGKTYFYKVLAEDWSSNRQAESPVASATTPSN